MRYFLVFVFDKRPHYAYRVTTVVNKDGSQFDYELEKIADGFEVKHLFVISVPKDVEPPTLKQIRSFVYPKKPIPELDFMEDLDRELLYVEELKELDLIHTILDVKRYPIDFCVNRIMYKLRCYNQGFKTPSGNEQYAFRAVQYSEEYQNVLNDALLMGDYPPLWKGEEMLLNYRAKFFLQLENKNTSEI